MTKHRLSPATYDELALAYPHHSNPQLEKMFGVSAKNIQTFGSRRGLKKLPEIAASALRAGRAGLTPEQMAERDDYMRKHYPTKTAREIASALDVSLKTVQELARKLGLKKAPPIKGPGLAQATQPVNKQPGWASANRPNDKYARLTDEQRAKLPAVTPPNVKRTVAPSFVDTRFSVAPGESTYGAGFAALGPGRYCEDGRTWGGRA